MSGSNVVVTAEDHERFQGLLAAIGRDANARLVYLIDKAGQHIASFGGIEGVDPTSLASLTAGNVAATEGVAALVGESEFSSQYHEGTKDSLHISVHAQRLILLVVFDEQSSPGLVRLRVEQHSQALEQAWETLATRKESDTVNADDPSEAFADLTESDIDALFG